MWKPAPVPTPSRAVIHSVRRFCLWVKIPRIGGTGRSPSHASQAGWPGQLSVPSPSVTRVYLPSNDWEVCESVAHGRLYSSFRCRWPLWLMPQCRPVSLQADAACLARMPAWRPCCERLLREAAEKGDLGSSRDDCQVIAASGPVRMDFFPWRSSGTSRTSGQKQMDSLASVSRIRNKMGRNCYPICNHDNLF